MSRKRWSAVVLTAIGVLCLLLFFPCLVTVRITEGWMWSANSLRQIGFAMRSYHDANGRLPPAVVRDRDGRPLYSWRVAILPYIEEEMLYRQFRLDEPWDSEHNKQFVERMPRVYSYRSRDDHPGLTRFQVLVGPGTAFERPGLTWGDFPDGLASTLLAVEAADPVVWTKPDDLAYDPSGPLPRLGGVHTRPVHFLCREVGRRPGFVACFADGSARFVRSSTDEALLRAAVTRNGGERLDASDLE